MRFSLDKAMGVHEQALYVRAKRSEVIASNLANSDTPNYKAQDLDFKSVLRNAAGMADEGQMRITNAKHMQPGGSSASDADLLYRTPLQPSIDGNTVDSQMEKSRFGENAMMYQTSLSFLTGKIKGLQKAIKGGE